AAAVRAIPAGTSVVQIDRSAGTSLAAFVGVDNEIGIALALDHHPAPGAPWHRVERARARAAASSVGALQALAETATALASDPDGAPERVRAARRAARELGLLRLPLPAAVPMPRRGAATAGRAGPTGPAAACEPAAATQMAHASRTGAPRPNEIPGTGPSLVATPRRPLLTVRCFGGFGLRVDGTELDLRTVRPQARAVLRILALNCGGAVHRELLAEVLWGRLDGEAAIHALHVSISSLRRGLAGTASGDASFVEREGEAYRLELGDRRDCDLGSFDAGLQAAATAKCEGDADATAAELRRATALYTGEVLPEDGPAEWVVGARERYRTRAAEASASLAHLELHLGDTGAAVAAATRAVEIDPWLDQGWRTLVTVHRSSGDAVAARRAEAGYRRMLGALGVD
ncbi:AfsR/SARP family transcriptional regulator, partial [Agromyces soli]